jgi:GTP-binding protein
VLVHLVAVDNEDPAKEYVTIREELGKYDKELLTRDEIVVLSKTDMVDEEEVKKKKKALEKASGKEVTTLSLYEDDSVKMFGDLLMNHLRKTA